MKVKFFSVSGKSAADLQLPADMVLLHGEELDDRGESACRSAPENDRVKLSFDVEDMSLTVGSQKKPSDSAVELLSGYDWRKVVLEATTLGFAELFCATNALLASGAALLRKPVSRRHDPSPGRTHATATTGTVCGRPI
jgi:hypothetical protein